MTRGIYVDSALLRRLWCALCVLMLAAVLLFPAAAQAQSTGSVVVAQQARAVMVTPASLVAAQPLQFGQILPTTTGGTVTVDPINGSCAATALTVLGHCQFAQFVGMGTNNMNVRLTLVTNSDLTGPGQAMVLDQIVLGFNNTVSFSGNGAGKGKGAGLNKGGNIRYRITSTSGIFSLNFGGTLHVNANQAAGVYNGTITISVQYQ